MSRKNLDIFEIRKEVYERDNYQCKHKGCFTKGWDNLQLAHKISRSKKNIDHVIKFMFREYNELVTRKEAEAVLNNKLNLVTSCSLHNQSFLIDNNPVEMGKLLMCIVDGENAKLPQEY